MNIKWLTVNCEKLPKTINEIHIEQKKRKYNLNKKFGKEYKFLVSI